MEVTCHEVSFLSSLMTKCDFISPRLISEVDFFISTGPYKIPADCFRQADFKPKIIEGVKGNCFVAIKELLGKAKLIACFFIRSVR